MPRNQKEGINARLARAKLAHGASLGSKPLSATPGAQEWVDQKNRDNPLIPIDTRVRYDLLTPEEQDSWRKAVAFAPLPDPATRRNQVLLDNIIGFITACDWQYIEGGKHDGQWVNRRYPNKIFDSGRVYDRVDGSYEYFPVSSPGNDPEGIALRHETSGGGTWYTVKPNAWTAVEDTRRGRRSARASIRFDKRRAKRLRYEVLERAAKETR